MQNPQYHVLGGGHPEFSCYRRGVNRSNHFGKPTKAEQTSTLGPSSSSPRCVHRYPTEMWTRVRQPAGAGTFTAAPLPEPHPQWKQPNLPPTERTETTKPQHQASAWINLTGNARKNKRKTDTGLDRGPKLHWLFQQRLFNINNC